MNHSDEIFFKGISKKKFGSVISSLAYSIGFNRLWTTHFARLFFLENWLEIESNNQNNLKRRNWDIYVKIHI